MKKIILIIILIFIFISLNAEGNLILNKNNKADRIAIMTSFTDHQQKRLVDALIKSVREFGGEYADCPIFVGLPDRADFPYDSLKRKGVTLINIKADKKVGDYLFAFKALVASEVEKREKNNFNTLVWFDPGVIVLGDLKDLDLQKVKGSAVLRTVSLNNNIGLTRKDALNEYWGRIYKETGLEFEEVPYTRTIIDQVETKAYLNCQVYSIDPKLGLLEKWGDLLKKLILDEEYQSKNCVGFRQRIFLHQAIFTGIVLSNISWDQIKKMPLRSNYPVSHHKRINSLLQVKSLDDVNVAVYDERWSRDSNWIKILPTSEHLKKWLNDTYLEYIKLAENFYRIEGSCNSYLITTKKGSVMIDPNGASSSGWFKKIMKKHPLKIIILTHSHADHWENMDTWETDENIKIIAQRKFVDHINYTDRMSGFFARRNAIWGRKPIPKVQLPQRKTKIAPNFFFTDEYKFEFGGYNFELYHTPGETPDHTTIWVPELKAVFIGDNYYEYFINNATFRGTTTRPMLGYINAIKMALSFRPEFFLPGHDQPIIGKGNIKKKITRFYDTLTYIHDETVKGMNLGKDVFTLMQEIKLPEELEIQPYFGKVSWTVRGIYNEYAGWFDEDPATMYTLPESSIYSDILELAGGPDNILKRAEVHLKKKEFIKVLHLTKIILTADQNNRKANEIRLEALKSLKKSTYNYIERIWLDYGIRKIVDKKKEESEKLFLKSFKQKSGWALSKVTDFIWNTRGFSEENNRITGLGFFNGSLKKWPEGIWKLEKLKYLYAGNNNLNPIPEKICQLKDLQEIWLNFNQLTELPKCLFNLSKITRMSLYSNNITQLPEEIGQLNNLVELHLAKNKLKILPDSIGTITQLKILDISDNPIESLPENFKELINLEVLAIKGIKLNYPLEFLNTFAKLKRLKIDKDQLPFIPEEVKTRDGLKLIIK